jgi:thiamine-phosphate pyrophosphorylase
VIDFKAKPNAILRIIDVNLNRSNEALRVLEEISRFILNSISLTRRLKKIRHSLNLAARLFCLRKSSLICHRDILRDVGKATLECELKRGNVQDIFFANMQRLKESLRVLEEFLKLKHKKRAVDIKKIRYSVYELEKKIAEKM